MDWGNINKQMEKETAKKGLMAKILALPMTVRVIAAVVCLVILAGAYILIAGSMDSGAKNSNVTILSESDVSELENLDWQDLIDCSESEMLTRFAGGSQTHENDGYWYYSYNFCSEDGERNQYISATFDRDVFGSECPVSIAFSGNIISIYDINTDTEPETVRGILESRGLYFDGTDKYSYDGVEYVSEVYYTRDKADVCIYITFCEGTVNGIDIHKMWDYGPNGEILPATGYFGDEDEPVIEEEYPEKDIVINEPVIEESIVEEDHEEPAMTNDEAHNILLADYTLADESWYYFVDLSGDGIDEMINMAVDYWDGATGIVQIYMVQGEKAVKIAEKYNGDMNSYMVEYYLYTENGRNFILEYNSFMRQGHGEIYYKIYAYDASGNEVMLRENSYSGDMTSAEGESASSAIHNEFLTYKANGRSILLVTMDGFESNLR